jgi:hypothetical protein
MAEGAIDQTSKNFGIAIAFLVPGFLGLWALSYFDPTAAKWLGTAAQQETTIGGFLFVLLASTGIGVFLSGARYFVFDRFLLKDLRRPDLDASKRKELEPAYQSLKEDYYRYYQFYSNTAVALALAFFAWWATKKPPSGDVVIIAVATAAAEVILYFSARDSLEKYHHWTSNLLGLRTPPPPGKKEAA